MFSDKKSANSVLPNLITSTHRSGLSHNLEINVCSQIHKLELSSITAANTSSGLQHLFNKKDLSPDQSHDLLSFRHRLDWVWTLSMVLCPSVKTPKPLKCLLTFTERRSRKISDIEKEQKLNVGRRELCMLLAPVYKWTLRTSTMWTPKSNSSPWWSPYEGNKI